MALYLYGRTVYDILAFAASLIYCCRCCNKCRCNLCSYWNINGVPYTSTELIVQLQAKFNQWRVLTVTSPMEVVTPTKATRKRYDTDKLLHHTIYVYILWTVLTCVQQSELTISTINPAIRYSYNTELDLQQPS